jgi:hypothetical protein
MKGVFMDINERFVKLTGKVCVPNDYQLGDTIDLSLFHAEVVKIENKDNQDQTMDVVFVAKVIESL